MTYTKITVPYTKNLQIIACAGSGKTQVISKRIITILKNLQIQPKNIVAFTYTEKAAVELKNRIHKIAEEENLKRTGMAELFVGTIHAWCLKAGLEDLYRDKVIHTTVFKNLWK